MLEGTSQVWIATTKRGEVSALTNGDRGDLRIKVQHPVAIHIDQVIASALFIIAEEMHSFCILGERETESGSLQLSRFSVF